MAVKQVENPLRNMEKSYDTLMKVSTRRLLNERGSERVKIFSPVKVTASECSEIPAETTRLENVSF